MLNSCITNYHPNAKLTLEDTEIINSYFSSIDDEEYEHNENYSIFKNEDHYNFCRDTGIAFFCCGVQTTEMSLKYETVFLVFDYRH